MRALQNPEPLHEVASALKSVARCRVVGELARWQARVSYEELRGQERFSDLQQSKLVVWEGRWPCVKMKDPDFEPKLCKTRH